MNNNKQLIIIGGGASIKEGIKKDLWQRLKDKFTIGINFSYRFFKDATFQCYLDKQVREKNLEDFEALQLVITKKQPIKNHINELQIVAGNKYSRVLHHEGIYKGSLTGIYALTLGINLLDVGEIYLLGYDYGSTGKKDAKERSITHFYQGKIEHRGIGKDNYYKSKGRADRDFGVYLNETKVRVFNVSLNSTINTFPKISYDEFFKRLDNKKHNQPQLRDWIKEKVNKFVTNKKK